VSAQVNLMMAMRLSQLVRDVPGATVAAGLVTQGSTFEQVIRSSLASPSISAQTPFRIGSLSKVITASALLSLAAEGTVDLDAPLSDYIDVRGARWPVRVKHLPSHSTGAGFYVRRSDRINPAAVLGVHIGASGQVVEPTVLRQAFEPGMGWLYGHFSAALAARIIEKCVAAPFMDWMNDGFLPRCGMATAAYGRPEAYRRIAPGTTTLAGRIVPLPRVAPASEASCGLSASLNDLLIYVRSIIRGGGMGLPAEVCRAHMSNGLPGRPECPFVTTGFRMTSKAGHILVIHGGNWFGYSAGLVLDQCCGHASVCLVSGSRTGIAQATAQEILMRAVHQTSERLDAVSVPGGFWEFRGLPPHHDFHLVLRAGSDGTVKAVWRWGKQRPRHAPVLRDVRNPPGRFVARAAGARIEIALMIENGNDVIWVSGSRHRFPAIAELRLVRNNHAKLTELAAATGTDDGREKLPVDGQIAARWRT
jgi:CubicO group peptidase (beta-lactamase class C family)